VYPPYSSHRYITSPAIPEISCSLFPFPPNPPGITIGNVGGGPNGNDCPLSVMYDGENTGGGGDVSSVTDSWYGGGGMIRCCGGGGGGGVI